MNVRIYLDCCCYNRPYDDLSRLTVSLEAQAKLHIQDEIKAGKYELATSEMLNFEVGNCPIEVRRDTITGYIEENSSVHVGPDSAGRVEEIAREIMRTGVKYKDACHVASAILSGCDYFISTDKRLLKYRSDKLKIVNPIEFLSEMEDTGHE